MKANQDIRQYMEDYGVTQRMLCAELGMPLSTLNGKLKTELPAKVKEELLNAIDSIVRDENRQFAEETLANEPEEEESGTKFQIGDLVKIPSKSETIGIVTDIWVSSAQYRAMYEVESNGIKGLYAENQLEPAPIPTEYSFESHIDNNVAVVAMIAKQGEKTWVYARGHAHILHDGEVGMAQAVSYAAKRMFESLDSKQENKIYAKGGI